MNRKLLEYVIARSGYTASGIAKKLGISRTTYYNKLSGKSPITHGDICRLITVCSLTMNEVRDIFFDKVVPPQGTME